VRQERRPAIDDLSFLSLSCTTLRVVQHRAEEREHDHKRQPELDGKEDPVAQPLCARVVWAAGKGIYHPTRVGSSLKIRIRAGGTPSNVV
jgi:hypothetical protein